MITLLMLTFSSFALYLSWKDHKTTEVTLLDLLVLAGLGGLIAIQTPFHHTSLTEHLIGAGLALVVTWGVRWFGQAWTKREAFGEADVWVATTGGALIGMQWLPVWLGASTAAGLFFYLFLSREEEDGHKILPFLPTMLATLLIIAWARWWSLLPPTWF
jgi:prepilin signal peptidase PulO-like enzyme (type II secretory pathway)